MHSSAEHNVMDNWPLERRLGYQARKAVEQKLSALGFVIWENRYMLIPKPFAGGALRCKIEAWSEGLVFEFAQDPYAPAVLPWTEFYTSSTYQDIMQLLIKYSHPLRFSPYCHFGPEEFFVGRKAELELMGSKISGLIICGESGTGKTSLLLQAASKNKGGYINCQGFTYYDLEARLQSCLVAGQMPMLLFLDEFDFLLKDPRTSRLLAALNRREIGWRLAVHQASPGLAANLTLTGVGKGEDLLLPLAKICGVQLEKSLEQAIMAKAAGKVGNLHYLCRLILQNIGYGPRVLDRQAVEYALREFWLKGGNAYTQQAI